VGVVAFTNGTRNGPLWLSTELARLLNRVLGVPEPAVRTDIPHRPDAWADLCGRYYLPGPLTDVRVRAFMGVGVEVFVRGGRLHLRFLTPVPALATGFPLHPDDEENPHSFVIDLSGFGFGTFPVHFAVEPGTGTAGVYFEVMPLSAHKRPQRRQPVSSVEGGAAGLAMALRRMTRSRWGRRTPTGPRAGRGLPES
jgi:hypothetical protein